MQGTGGVVRMWNRFRVCGLTVRLGCHQCEMWVRDTEGQVDVGPADEESGRRVFGGHVCAVGKGAVPGVSLGRE